MTAPLYQRVVTLTCVLVMIAASASMITAVVLDGPWLLFFGAAGVLLFAANTPATVTATVQARARARAARMR